MWVYIATVYIDQLAYSMQRARAKSCCFFCSCDVSPYIGFLELSTLTVLRGKEPFQPLITGKRWTYYIDKCNMTRLHVKCKALDQRASVKNDAKPVSQIAFLVNLDNG